MEEMIKKQSTTINFSKMNKNIDSNNNNNHNKNNVKIEETEFLKETGEDYFLNFDEKEGDGVDLNINNFQPNKEKVKTFLIPDVKKNPRFEKPKKNDINSNNFDVVLQPNFEFLENKVKFVQMEKMLGRKDCNNDIENNQKNNNTNEYNDSTEILINNEIGDFEMNIENGLKTKIEQTNNIDASKNNLKFKKTQNFVNFDQQMGHKNNDDDNEKKLFENEILNGENNDGNKFVVFDDASNNENFKKNEKILGFIFIFFFVFFFVI
jgi:hypothetical protein